MKKVEQWKSGTSSLGWRKLLSYPRWCSSLKLQGRERGRKKRGEEGEKRGDIERERGREIERDDALDRERETVRGTDREKEIE